MSLTNSPLKRAVFIWSVAAILMLVVLVVAPAVGPTRINLAQALWGAPENADARIFHLARLPRVLLAAAVGAALAISGAAYQSLLRNPLADPFTLGISSGASLGAILVLGTLGELASFWMVPLGSFSGAIMCLGIIMAVSRRHTDGVSMILTGITINIILSAVVVAVRYVSTPFQSMSMMRWMIGSLDTTSLAPAAMVGATLVLAGGFVLLGAKKLNVLSLGDETAMHLGVDARREKRRLLIAASFLTAVAVSVSGPIGFVGLIVPHAVRLLCGPDNRVLMPTAAMVGAAFLTLCDTGARSVLAAEEIPVGLVTSILGGPLFLAMLLGRRTRTHRD